MTFVKSATFHAKGRVATVQYQLLRARAVGRAAVPGLPNANSLDAFWQSLRIDQIPDGSLAMLICKALVPDNVTQDMGGWRVLQRELYTWSNRTARVCTALQLLMKCEMR